MGYLPRIGLNARISCYPRNQLEPNGRDGAPGKLFETMPFAYYRKLSSRQKRIYRESDQIEKIVLHKPLALIAAVEPLEQALASGNRLATQRAAQGLLDRLTTAQGVHRIRVSVLERRPSWSTGELHGLYDPDERGQQKISLWMRTAQRNQVVKFKTFLRTFLHELCHHLDYERFHLEESFHTEGFYKRESSLLRQLYPGTGSPKSQPR